MTLVILKEEMDRINRIMQDSQDFLGLILSISYCWGDAPSVSVSRLPGSPSGARQAGRPSARLA